MPAQHALQHIDRNLRSRGVRAWARGSASPPALAGRILGGAARRPAAGPGPPKRQGALPRRQGYSSPEPPRAARAARAARADCARWHHFDHRPSRPVPVAAGPAPSLPSEPPGPSAVGLRSSPFRRGGAGRRRRSRSGQAARAACAQRSGNRSGAPGLLAPHSSWKLAELVAGRIRAAGLKPVGRDGKREARAPR